MRPHWTVRARRDLAAIYDYIARDNTYAPEQVDEAIATTAERLASHPYQGRPGRREGTRELVVAEFPAYLIVYRVTNTDVRILRVWHGRQSRHI
jgi:toxin ParE1/3/4